MSEKLKKGQVIIIRNERYTVIGMIEFKEDTWIWQEYKLKSQKNQIKWLSVEEDDGKTKYSLYELNRLLPESKEINFKFKNEEYSLFEQGTARVNNYYGNVDVDRNEKVNFREYINDKKNKLISVEEWCDEVEKSIGEYIPETDITVTNEIEKVTNDAQKGSILAVVSIFIMTFVFIFISAFASIITDRTVMSKFIEKNSKFEYVTSITNNENDQKAKVYKTNMTIDETVKTIIDGLPEKVKKVTNSSEDLGNNIGLFTNYEYAYVYESEDGTTYVQVSKKKFVTSNTNSYRSRYRNYGYYRTYSTNSTHSSYTTYLNSARQQSISARKSSGGGTSSGK